MIIEALLVALYRGGYLPVATLEEYLLDHYGVCGLAEKCRCRRAMWLGRKCAHWRPAGARQWDEVIDATRKMSNLRRADGSGLGVPS